MVGARDGMSRCLEIAVVACRQKPSFRCWRKLGRVDLGRSIFVRLDVVGFRIRIQKLC